MVSVIIPNYNHQAFLKQRINSVLDQSYRDYEVIILDDCSLDESRTIIDLYRDHPKIAHIVFNDVNSGSTFKQWNKGIELARGDLIWIAESDDLADQEFLQTLVLLFEQDPELGICYCQSSKLTEDKRVIGNWKSWTDDLDKDLFQKDFILTGADYINRFLIYRNTIPNASAVVFRKKKYLQVGHANEEIKYCSDWLTWLKILSVSNIAFSAHTLNSFRTHNHSVISKALSDNQHSYMPSFERLMREEFSRFLNACDMEDLRSVKVKNNALIGNMFSEEGLFHIRQNNWKKGWGNLMKGSKKGLKVKIILKAALLSFRSVYTNQNL